MNVQFFIVQAPIIAVSTSDGMIVSPGLQMQCGICPARVFVQQLTNLLPLTEHARTHEPRMTGAKCDQAPLRRGEVLMGRAASANGTSLARAIDEIQQVEEQR